MAIIPQRELFSWDQVEVSSDLDRLRMVLEAIPDEKLMQVLEGERKGRRDDYPIRAVWNSLLGGVVFGHPSVESLRRELLRNGELRQVCGFSVLKGDLGVPPAWVYTRFLKRLFKHGDMVEAIFDRLVGGLKELLPEFGKRLAVDSKGVRSHGRPCRGGEERKKADGRRDREADWGVKRYGGEREDGTGWEKVKAWFGYKVHLMVDSEYELPVTYRVTRASANDGMQLLPMMEELEGKHPELVERAEYLSGDKGYDWEENNRELWDGWSIKPIVAIRNTWQEEAELPRQLYGERGDTIFYNEKGEVLCRCLDGKQESKNYARMAFEGFEKSRGCLKYRCPAAAYGMRCTQQRLCNGGEHSERGRIVRVPLERDRRIFVPQARSSYGWAREYKRRTAVERVNSRLDVSFGFERHFIRGLKKMQLRVGLGLVVMLAMAVGWIAAEQEDRIRSLVKRRAA